MVWRGGVRTAILAWSAETSGAARFEALLAVAEHAAQRVVDLDGLVAVALVQPDQVAAHVLVGVEGDVLDAEGLEDVLLDVGVEGEAGDALDGDAGPVEANLSRVSISCQRSLGTARGRGRTLYSHRDPGWFTSGASITSRRCPDSSSSPTGLPQSLNRSLKMAYPNPLVCANSILAVISPLRSTSLPSCSTFLPFSSGHISYSRWWESRSSLPCSTSCMHAIVVMSLVQEAIQKTESIDMGVGSERECWPAASWAR